MKKIIAFLVALLIACMLMGATSEAYIPSEKTEQDLQDTNDKATILEYLEIYEDRMKAANTMANSARELGYPEDNQIILTAKTEWNNAKQKFDYYNEKYTSIVKKEKKVKYPEATYVWDYLKSKGYNDYVCAGIMGNLMAEVGGQTLNLKVYSKSQNYYGMCQWQRGYYKVWGKDLKGQCEFLADTIEYNMNTFGFCYQQGFNYSQFCEMKSAAQAALAFAACYERCGSGSYSVRAKNAQTAYNYYVLGEQ